MATPFLFDNHYGTIYNMKYADADGDGIIEEQRGTLPESIYEDLATVATVDVPFITDVDIVYANANKTHQGNNSSFNKNILDHLKIVYYEDSIAPNGDNLVLSVYAGDDLSPTINMQRIAFKVHFDVGIHNRPNIAYDQTHFGNCLRN